MGETVPLPFPLAGVHLDPGLSAPRPLTTPVGVNCRSFDVLGDRNRGGSRPGLAKLVTDRLPHVAALPGGIE